MCFSPTASFAAAGVLSAIGIATVAQAKTKREIPLACIPLIFGIQQFIEGFVWLSLLGNGAYALPLSYLYTFFALLWWPIFAPLVGYLLEPDELRRKLIFVLGLGGLVCGIFQYGLFISHGAAAQIVNQCVYYKIETPWSYFFIMLYALSTIGVGIFSSRRIVKIFGLLLAISAMISWRFYSVNFTSVWCFFAAILSMVLLAHFTRSRWAARVYEN